jgi:hypothetical protein
MRNNDFDICVHVEYNKYWCNTPCPQCQENTVYKEIPRTELRQCSLNYTCLVGDVVFLAKRRLNFSAGTSIFGGICFHIDVGWNIILDCQCSNFSEAIPGNVSE